MMDYSKRKASRRRSSRTLEHKLNFYRNLFSFCIGFLTCLVWVLLYGY